MLSVAEREELEVLRSRYVQNESGKKKSNKRVAKNRYDEKYNDVTEELEGVQNEIAKINKKFAKDKERDKEMPVEKYDELCYRLFDLWDKEKELIAQADYYKSLSIDARTVASVA